MTIRRHPPTPASAARVLTGWFIVVLLTAGWIPGPGPARAAAAVLQGPHVLELTAAAMGRISALQARQELWLYPQHPEAAPTRVDETVTYVMPERFRSDMISDHIQRTHLVFGDRSLTVIDGRMIVPPSPFDRYEQVLRSRTRPRLIRTLNQLGVETAISSLGRVEQQVVFVIGARYPDESVSQLALNQTTFLPVRLLLIATGADTAQRMEIFFHDWRNLQNGAFPMRIDFFIDGRLARKIRVIDLDANPSIPADHLDVEALRHAVAREAARSPHDRKEEAVEAVQQALRDFQKKFE